MSRLPGVETPPCAESATASADQEAPAELEVDEMWTFVGRRSHKIWLWLAVERPSRRIVAWVLGCRGAATARRLWQALPARYQQHTRYYSDEWEAYAKVLPAPAHQPSPKGSGQTSIVEAINCSLRQYCGVLVRKSCSLQQVAPDASCADSPLYSGP